MVITKPGDIMKVARTRRFECGYCGCEFFATTAEYKTEWDGVRAKPACTCPTCHMLVFDYTNIEYGLTWESETPIDETEGGNGTPE